MISQNILI